MARFLNISLANFAPATTSNCEDLSAAISFGPPPWAALSLSLRVDRGLCR